MLRGESLLGAFADASALQETEPDALKGQASALATVDAVPTQLDRSGKRLASKVMESLADSCSMIGITSGTTVALGSSISSIVSPVEIVDPAAITSAITPLSKAQLVGAVPGETAASLQTAEVAMRSQYLSWKLKENVGGSTQAMNTTNDARSLVMISYDNIEPTIWERF